MMRIRRTLCDRISGMALALFTTLLMTGAAQAQDDRVEEVVVTGTSIRGAAPIGSNVITVGPQEIQRQGGQTLDEILKSVPALSNKIGRAHV